MDKKLNFNSNLIENRIGIEKNNILLLFLYGVILFKNEVIKSMSISEKDMLLFFF